MDFLKRYLFNPETDLLGEGGFSKVYKGFDIELERNVALKIFDVKSNSKGTLKDEIRKAIHLDHPNLCRYYDFASVKSNNVFGQEVVQEIGVMELLEGGDLKSYLRKNPKALNELLVNVLSGLEFLHEKGIIHRDLKPQNILIKETSKGPIAKITDFGISKEMNSSQNSSSALMGTIEYMAPEQFSPEKYGTDGKIGTNVDLWGFGVMVYELVKGEKLFGSRGVATSAEQIMTSILSDGYIEDKLSKLPNPYLEICKLCLVKSASKRVQTANTLIPLFKNSNQFFEHQEDDFDSNATRKIDFEETRNLSTDDLETKILSSNFDEGLKNDRFENKVNNPTKINKPEVSTSLIIILSVVLVLFAFGAYRLVKSRSSSEIVLASDSTSASNNNLIKKRTSSKSKGKKRKQKIKDNELETYNHFFDSLAAFESSMLPTEDEFGSDDKIETEDGYIYEGRTKNEIPNGYGILTYPDGNKYEGYFVDGVREGEGIFIISPKQIEEGYFINGCPDCLIYFGTWKEDKKDGMGRCYGLNGKLLYVGKFKENEPVSKYPNQ